VRPPAARDEKLIALGIVMGSHGLHGLLRVKPYNAESDTLLTAPRLWLRAKAGAPQAFGVRSVKPADKGLFVQLEGVDSVERSKTLHGSELCVPRSALPALRDGEYYFADLEGLQAVTPGSEVVGTVQRVVEYPAASVLLVVRPEGTIEVPMREPYLHSVDLAGGRVVIDHLEDLP
jgi:16S rRNA processing protein RimM